MSKHRIFVSTETEEINKTGQHEPASEQHRQKRTCERNCKRDETGKKGIEGEAYDNVKLCSGAPPGAVVGRA
jgi:hypothetical protein